MIFIEMMSPKGHIRLNEFYLEALWEPGDRLILGESLQGSYTDFSPILFRDRFGNFISRIYSAIAALRLIPIGSKREICFLSYDLLLMPAVVALLRLRGWRVFAFEHNTTPNSPMKRSFHRAIGKEVCHFSYAPYVSDRFSNLGLKVRTISHPILTSPKEASGAGPEVALVLSRSGEFENVVFCPSASVSWEQIEPLATSRPRTLFVVKSNAKVNAKNVLSFPFFEEYLEILAICDAVYIPFSRDDKVSGPFFEALGAGKIVVVKDNVFGRYAKSEFACQVRFEDEEWSQSSCHVKVDLISHNLGIIADLRAVLRGMSGS